MITFTLRVYHSDYNISLLEVEATNSTEALIAGLKWYKTNKQYLSSVVRIELDNREE